MRRVTWSGDVPADEAEARHRIVEATVRCLQRHGVEHTSLAAIAAEAGVSRPTLYAYFENRDDLVQQAVLAITEAFLVRVIDRARSFDAASDRLVEATLFTVHEIRAEPVLAARFRVGQMQQGPITDEELYFAKLALEPVAELAPSLRAWLDEAAEVTARLVISLLIRDAPHPRSEADDRAFLHRWLPQALGLTDARAACP